MQSERRQSMRVVTTLPCQWQTFETRPHRGDVIDCFAASQGASRRRAAASLDAAIEQALEEISDKATRRVLQLMKQKLDLLTPPLAEAATPQAVRLEVSAEGLRVPSPAALVPGSYVGLHLVLANGADHFAVGEVRHSTPAAEGGYQSGIACLNEEECRPLARLVMRAGAQATS